MAAVALGNNAGEAVPAAGGGLPRAARVPNQWPTKTPKAKTKAKQQHVPKMTTIMLLVCGGLGKKNGGIPSDWGAKRQADMQWPRADIKGR